MTHTFTVLAAFAAVGWSGAILLWMEGKRARRLAKQKTLSAEELYQSNQLLKPAINSPVGEQIAEFVGKVCVDIEYKVKELEQIRVKIAIPLATVVSEIQSTRLADRRERFEQYKTVLLNANSRLCSEIDSLMIAYDYLTNSAFSKIGVGLDKSLGGDSHEE